MLTNSTALRTSSSGTSWDFEVAPRVRVVEEDPDDDVSVMSRLLDSGFKTIMQHRKNQ
jgi:hypothetical protein